MQAYPRHQDRDAGRNHRRTKDHVAWSVVNPNPVVNSHSSREKALEMASSSQPWKDAELDEAKELLSSMDAYIPTVRHHRRFLYLAENNLRGFRTAHAQRRPAPPMSPRNIFCTRIFLPIRLVWC